MTIAALLTLSTLSLTPVDAGAPKSAEAPDAGVSSRQLTPAMIDGFHAYIEWVMDVHLTQSQLEESKALIEKAWADKTPVDTSLVQETLTAQADLANHSEADRMSLRPSVEDEYLKQMSRRYRSALGRWVLSVRDAVKKPLVGGKPPLTRQDAEAYSELLAFILNEAGGMQPVMADKAFRAALAKVLSADYRGYSAEQKEGLAGAARDWAALRSSWAGWPESKKGNLRTAWRDAFKEVREPAPAKGKVEPASLKGDAGTPAQPLPAVQLQSKAFRAAARELAAKINGWL